ncbi:MAG: NAD(P)H-binding protein [Nitrospirae bacterium]|nr:NAD(P)H-binding protein [Nitrospirota bacterium]
MKTLEFTKQDRVLVTGATGFIGSRLAAALKSEGVKQRLFIRGESADSKDPYMQYSKGDLLTGSGLDDALEGIHTAFYLVHSMGGKNLFKNTEYADKDRNAADNFVKAADKAGVKRIIYLGGLGEARDELSEHLKSRMEIASILSSGTAAATFLRAAIIIGAGGASFEMLRYLVERLPVMVCPRWINTRIQPIAVNDVIAYLYGCLNNPETAGKAFDIGGPEIFTYKEMMQKYAEARGLRKRIVITVPFLTPHLSAYWVDMVTPVPSGLAHPLIEGLRNEVVCKDDSIDQLVKINKTRFADAVKLAFSEEKSGPGVTGW